MTVLLATCPRCGSEVPTSVRIGPSGMPRIGELRIVCPSCARPATVAGSALRQVSRERPSE